MVPIRALRQRQGGRRVNLLLGLLLLLAMVTGVAAEAVGVNWPVDLVQVHAGAAFTILLLAPWKSLIIRRGLRRRPPGRRHSLALLALVLVAAATGLLHATGRLQRVGPLLVMQVHIGVALLILVPLVGHLRAHPVRPRSTDPDRRALLRAGGLAGAGALAVVGSDAALRATAPATGPRRFTGSVPEPRGNLSAMPVTSWLDDVVPEIDPQRWRLRVGEAALDLDAVRALPHISLAATLDCTGGWSSDQTWQGVRLSDVLAAAGVRPVAAFRSLEVRSVTGYARWFGVSTLDDVWLVTGVGGLALPAGHGFPARVVAPGRRGFWWVKWVEALRPSARPAWAQSPFPLS